MPGEIGLKKVLVVYCLLYDDMNKGRFKSR